MKDINAVLAEIEVKSSGIKTVSESASDQMEEVRERIKNGESTGDRIKDFLLCGGAWGGEETEKTLRNVQSKLSEHPGEFILVIERKESFEGCVGFGYEPRNEDYRLREHLTLAVLNGTELVIEIDPEKSRCSLPTSRHMSVYNTAAVNLKVKDGNLYPFWTISFWYYLNRPMELRNPWNRRRGGILEAELIIGDQAVNNWFGKNNTILHRAARKIGRESGIKVPQETEAV